MTVRSDQALSQTSLLKVIISESKSYILSNTLMHDQKIHPHFQSFAENIHLYMQDRTNSDIN